jgi:guanosine-3',5'-bis(diphosphate) 3'-pyrophosphohydrolase
MRSSVTLTRAYALARDAHSGQAGKDGRSPYIRHPLAVAELLAAEGLDEPTLVAAILHDVVESSELGIDEVVARFGAEVGELVSALTDDATIEDYEERREEHRARVAAAGPRAGAIYAADKLANVRELRNLYAEGGEAAAEERLPVSLGARIELWHRDLAMLESVAGDLEVTSELRDQLYAFEAERSRRPADVA